MIFRPSRDPDRPVRRLEWRMWLFGTGAVVALIGMASGQAWIIYLAIVLLAVGLVSRFIPHGGGHGGRGEGE